MSNAVCNTQVANPARTAGLYLAWLALAPLCLALAQGADLTSRYAVNTIMTNVLPPTTLAALAWLAVTHWVLGPGNFSKWRIALGVLLWLAVTPFVYAFAMGGVLLAVIHVFRVLPYAAGLAIAGLVLWALVSRFVYKRSRTRAALRLFAVGLLVVLPFFTQMIVFPLASQFANWWQMAYCERVIVPRIEAYRDTYQRMPGSLSQVMPAYLPIPPDVVYYEATLRVEDRGDVLSDWIYRSPGNWENTE